MATEWMLQSVEDFGNDETAAHLALAVLAEQVGYRGGRVLAPAPSKPTWRVQTFYDDAPAEWYPDGIRRVVVLDSLRAVLGIVR